MHLKPGKTAIRLIIAMAIMVAAIFLSISPIGKYVIEKNSETWTGRKITMGSLFINLLNWNITVKDLRVYEFKRNEVFFRVSSVHTELSFLQLLRGQYVLKTVQLVSPEVVIEQSGKRFNFDDLMKLFASEDTLKKTPEPSSKPVKYRIEAIAVKGGNITFRDKLLNHEIVIKDISLSCPLLAWNENNIRPVIGFSLKSGGKVISWLIMNTKSLSYSLIAKVDKLNLQLIYPYMKDYLKTSHAGGLFSSNLEIKGNFNSPGAVALKGDLGLAEFRLDDAQKMKVASWENFTIRIDSMNIASDIYRFGKISMDEPYMLVEMYANDDNFTRMMMPSQAETTVSTAVDSIDYSNPFTMMVGFINEISKDYIISNYTAAKVEINFQSFEQ